jgi:hypothetical protein
LKEKRDWENRVHREEQQTGIEDYESNLKRNGLGGETDSGAGAGEVLIPTTESSESYLNRIEDKVQTQWPSNSEVSDFMQNLEKRTRELRLARQEKARRKRRLQVEQKAALLQIGGSSAPPSRSNSIDVSSLLGTETIAEKNARKISENAEATQRSAVQRALQAEEGEKQIRIFAERRRMMAYENEDWQRKREAVLKAQAMRAKEKRIRTQALCQAMVLELVTDLFPTDATTSAVSAAAGGAGAGEQGEEDDIFHSNLRKDLGELSGAGATVTAEASLPIFSRVSRSNVADLYPSVALLAANIARWRLRERDGEQGEGESGEGGAYQRINSFRESALEIFQQVQTYSDSSSPSSSSPSAITPFSLDASSEFLPLLSSLTSCALNANMAPPQSIFLISGASHDLPQQTLVMAQDWLGGSQMLSLVTLPSALQIVSKLRAAVATGDDSSASADPSLVRFEHLYDLWGLDSSSGSAIDRSLFPEISFHASRIVSDLFDLLSRISAASSSSSGSALELPLSLSSFKFSDTSLAILLAQVLWLRDYVSSAISALRDPSSSAPSAPLTPIVLAAFNFGSPDRLATLRVFDWFLRGGSRTNLPEGDEEFAREIADEIATVPLEKGKKAAKPSAAGGGGKGKKDKRDPTELIKPTSPIAAVVWLQQNKQQQEKEKDESVPSGGSGPASVSVSQDHSSSGGSSSEGGPLAEVISRYAALLKQKALEKEAEGEGEALERAKATLESWTRDLNTPLLWLGKGSPTAPLAHPFNLLEGLIATVLATLPSLLPQPLSSEEQQGQGQGEEQQQQGKRQSSEVLSEEILTLLQHRRATVLSAPQRIWLSHITGAHPIALSSFRLSLATMREGLALEADALGGLVLSLLLCLQQTRSQMLTERAKMCHSLKLSESAWRVTCLQWRDELLDADKTFKQQLSASASGATSAAVSWLQKKSRELECELGDLIDVRHQRWTTELQQLSLRMSSLLEQVCETILLSVTALHHSLPQTLQRSLSDSLQLTALLEAAQYPHFPWPLRSSSSPSSRPSSSRAEGRDRDRAEGREARGEGMSRLESNRLRDEVRAQMGLLFTELNETLKTNTAVALVSSEESIALARDMLSDIDQLSPAPSSVSPSPSSPSALMGAVATEIKTEGYEMLATLLRALLESLRSLRELSHAVLSELTDFSFLRNQYEHRLLREWISELRQSFSSAPAAPGPSVAASPYSAAISFMSSFYYGVSDDPEHDGVPRSSLSNGSGGGGGLVEMGEMALSLRKIYLLSSEMLLQRTLSLSPSSSSLSEEPGTAAPGAGEAAVFEPFQFLTAAIQRLFDRSESLPLPWRQLPKLRSLVLSICEAHPSAALSAEHFSLELVLHLLYGALPLSPPSSFSLRLAHKLCSSQDTATATAAGGEGRGGVLSSETPTAVKLSTLLSVLDKDKTLSAGWWPPPRQQSQGQGQGKGQGAPEDHKDMVRLALEAMALACAIPETVKLRRNSSSGSGEAGPGGGGGNGLESVEIHLDKLLLSLCSGPSLANETVNALQRALCCCCTSSSSPLSSSQSQPPQFFYESMTKLLVLGSQLLRREEDEQGEEELQQEASLPALYRTVFGPVIPSPRPLVGWLTNLSGLDPKLFENLPEPSPGQPLLCRDLLETLRL